MNDFYKKAYAMLKERYEKCDSKDHIFPDYDANKCQYCFRTLKYQTPETDKIIESRKDLPLLKEPYDAPYLKTIRDREIDSQKSRDYFRGLNILFRRLKRRGRNGKVKKGLLEKLD